MTTLKHHFFTWPERLYQWLFGHVPAEAVIAVTMISMGLDIWAFPDRGTASYVHDVYGLSGAWYGLILMAGGFAMLKWPRPQLLLIEMAPLAFFVLVYVPFEINTPGASPASLSAMLLLVWFLGRVVYLRMSRYKIVKDPQV